MVEITKKANLLEKLKIYPDEIQRRQQIAETYTEALKDLVITPIIPAGYTSVWAQYTLQVEKRTEMAAFLEEAGIPTMVYYPLPMHLQKAYIKYKNGRFPNSEMPDIGVPAGRGRGSISFWIGLIS